jgi:hypothetical protein
VQERNAGADSESPERERIADGPGGKGGAKPLRVPIPAARPLGAVVGALGILLLVHNHLIGLFPQHFWTDGVPALGGMLAGILIGVGLLFCCWRFTLRFLVCAVVVVGFSATIGHWSGLHRARTIWYDSWADSDDVNALLRLYQFDEPHIAKIRSAVNEAISEQPRFIGEALVQAMRENGLTWGLLAPLWAETDPTHSRAGLHWRPHVEERFGALVQAYPEYMELRLRLSCLAVDGTAGPETSAKRRTLASQAAGLWCEVVRHHFGERMANSVAAASAEAVQDEQLRRAFQAIGEDAKNDE